MINGIVDIIILKKIDKLEFMYGRIKVFNKDEFYPKYDRNGYEIIGDSYSQDEVMGMNVFWLKCYPTNILIQKGDEHRINGADFIAVICHDCKKAYGFNDVKYKPNCPKEL